MSLSVVITAYNEEKNIGFCLDSVKWADEIIFVDNLSTDKTVEKARKYTKKIFSQKNDPAKIDLLKNLGIEKASGDWVLILDADEVVSNELAHEIKSLLKSSAAHSDEIMGYFIPRKNYIFGKWIQHTGWYPDLQLRLFKKGHGRFEEQHVHEPLRVDGELGELHEHIVHQNYQTVNQFLYRGLIVYAPNEAENLLKKGYVFDYKDLIRFPLKEFLSRYFAREGYKDGFYGLMLSFLMACYHFAIFAYLWEKSKFIEPQDDTLKGIGQEITKSTKDVLYWLHNKKLEEEKNILKKVGYKLKNKFLK